MKPIFFVVILCLITTVLMSAQYTSISIRLSKKVDQIQAAVAKKMSKKYEMNCIGVGGKEIGCTCWIALDFQICHPLNRDEARCILLDCTEELLKAVNENKEVRCFLMNYPFTTKNIDVAVFSTQPNGGNVYDPYITVASVCQSDKIDFCTSDPAKKYGYKNEYSENYKDALELIKKGQCDMSSFIRN